MALIVVQVPTLAGEPVSHMVHIPAGIARSTPIVAAFLPIEPHLEIGQPVFVPVNLPQVCADIGPPIISPVIIGAGCSRCYQATHKHAGSEQCAQSVYSLHFDLSLYPIAWGASQQINEPPAWA